MRDMPAALAEDVLDGVSAPAGIPGPGVPHQAAGAAPEPHGRPDPLAVVCSAREVLVIHGDASVQPFIAAIDLFMAGQDNFGEALGLPHGWRARMRTERRDDALAEIAATFFPGSCVRQLAREVATALSRYSATSWRRDRAAHHRPDGLHGLLFDVLMVSAPPGFSQLRNIFKALAGQSAAVVIGQLVPQTPSRRRSRALGPDEKTRDR